MDFNLYRKGKVQANDKEYKEKTADNSGVPIRSFVCNAAFKGLCAEHGGRNSGANNKYAYRKFCGNRMVGRRNEDARGRPCARGLHYSFRKEWYLWQYGIPYRG